MPLTTGILWDTKDKILICDFQGGFFIIVILFFFLSEEQWVHFGTKKPKQNEKNPNPPQDFL